MHILPPGRADDRCPMRAAGCIGAAALGSAGSTMTGANPEPLAPSQSSVRSRAMARCRAPWRHPNSCCGVSPVESWNAGAARLKGYSLDEILGQHFSRFYTPEDRAAGVPAFPLKTARETGRFHAEGWRVRKDGTRFWALVIIDPIRNDKGELIGYAKVTRDMTEQRTAIQARSCGSPTGLCTCAPYPFELTAVLSRGRDGGFTCLERLHRCGRATFCPTTICNPDPA